MQVFSRFFSIFIPVSSYAPGPTAIFPPLSPEGPPGPAWVGAEVSGAFVSACVGAVVGAGPGACVSAGAGACVSAGAGVSAGAVVSAGFVSAGFAVPLVVLFSVPGRL